MNIKLVGVSLEELEAVLKFSGLYVEVDGDYAELRQLPPMLRQEGTTLDMWEALGEAQVRAKLAEDKLNEVTKVLGK